MQTNLLAGQLFTIGFSGKTLHGKSPVIQDIHKRNLGGVILFDKLLALKQQTNNITTAKQVRNLTDTLQDAAGGGLLIGVDQEGGKVSRFRQEFGYPQTPQAAGLGEQHDVNSTQQAAAATAKTLREVGCNCNFAPVVDLNSFTANPIIGKYGRSFSADPDTVTRHAAAWIEEHRSQNIGCCLKHFPGHGSSREDSHLGFVDVTTTWKRQELVPYAALIGKGLADAVMTGHLFNSTLDREYPATLSGNTISLLKEELGFNGPVFSDDMQMGAIINRFGLEQAICMAFRAGVDMVIIGNNLHHDPDVLPKALEEIMRQVDSGKLSEERLHDAYTRVNRFKQRYCQLDK